MENFEDLLLERLDASPLPDLGHGDVGDPKPLAQDPARSSAGASKRSPPSTPNRRQPVSFSSIDYRLHNPAFAWHLIISLRNPDRAEVQPFLVRKDCDDIGIDETDDLEGSELSCHGADVVPINLKLTANSQDPRHHQEIPA